MGKNDYVVFILSHGRADNVKTFKTLRKQGYTGRIVIVIDNEDRQADRYIENFGAENVYIFDKKYVAERIDEGINSGDRRAIIYARNACFDIAKELGYRYFVQFDDDYSVFYIVFDSEFRYNKTHGAFLDNCFSVVFDYYRSSNNLASICFFQDGDIIGGADCTSMKSIGAKRKAMNSFFCDTERRFEFSGKINEDVNTYTGKQRSGLVFHSINQISLKQAQTQTNSGGMTDLYIDSGTYIKSFYSVMYCPSAVKVAVMNSRNGRIHHKVNYNLCAPKIIRESVKK